MKEDRKEIKRLRVLKALVELFVATDLISVEEGKFCIMTDGLLPRDILKRVDRKIYEEIIDRNVGNKN